MEKAPQRIEDVQRERAMYVLDALGVSFDSLEGKTILDVAAGSDEVAATLKKSNVDIFSTDLIFPEETDSGYSSETYTVADAHHLPFRASSFDLIFSHANPHFSNAEEFDMLMMEEMSRLLKDTGEIRIAPLFAEKDIFTEQSQVLLNKLQKNGFIAEIVDSTKKDVTAGYMKFAIQIKKKHGSNT